MTLTVSGDRAPADPVVLVTGGTGFVGARLTKALAARHPNWRLRVPSAPGVAPGVGAAPSLDITDAGAVSALIAAQRPDIVVHLAAVAAVTASVKDPRQAWQVNLNGTLNLVLALQEHAPNTHLLFVSSAEVYGASLGGEALTDETALLQPVNPYAASKAAADILVRQAAAAGLSATVMRPFNHTGAGQAEAFVAPSFAGQIARIELGLQPPLLKVGNLDDERDFLDVDDVVAAYLAVLEVRAQLEPGLVFNVASGSALRIGDILDQLLGQARVVIAVEVDPVRLRQTSVPRVVGDSQRLRQQTGWRPKISLKETFHSLLEDRRRFYGRQTYAQNGV